jgi:hypothetical protein
MREVQINSMLILREDGRLFNIKTGKEFIPAKSTQWTGFRIKVNGRTKYVHWLVLENFGQKCPGKEYVPFHKNDNKYDNDINNLEWIKWKDKCAMRNDALPVGQRKCDFETEDEYRCSNSKRYYNKNKEKITIKNREKHNIISNIRYNSDEEKKQKHLECCKRYEANHKEELKEKRKVQWKNWCEKQKQLGIPRKRNMEKERECSMNWRKNNKEKYDLIQKSYNENHKEWKREYNRIWRAEHPEKVKAYKQKARETFSEPLA